MSALLSSLGQRPGLQFLAFGALALAFAGCTTPTGDGDSDASNFGFGGGAGQGGSVGAGGGTPPPLPIGMGGEGGQPMGMGGGPAPVGGTGGEGAGGAGGGEPEDMPWCIEGEFEDCSNNRDDNCDGNVDEGCTCTVPEKPCYSGNPRDLEAPEGACREGTQACRLEFYGPCEGEIGPTEEICDGVDNDCNGETDELPDCQNTPPTAICPPPQEGSPLANYDFQGGYEDADGDPMVRATWRIVSAPGGSTATPEPPDALLTTIFADLLGDYELELEVEDSEGGIGRCTTGLHTVTEDGLRIEMVWNVNAEGDSSDVDMHLLRDPDATWFDNGPTGDDCFFANCKVCSGGSEEDCRAEIAEYNADPNRSPPPQVMWTEPLDSDDPRLDLDDVEGSGPENINILNPRPGTYRLGVHYWDDDGFGASTVSVRIFCGGELTREFEPIILEPRGTFGDPDTDFWEVADISWGAGACVVHELGRQGCRHICSRRESEAGGCPAAQRGMACN